MGLFFKRNRRKPPPAPAWLKWLLLLFVAYALIVSNMPGKTNNTFREARNDIAENAPAFGDYSDKIFPENASSLRISELEEGTGATAVCGQRVSIAYASFLAQGNALADKAGKENPLTFTIGDGNVMPVFDKGVVGMKVGGKRSVVAPPLMSYGLEDYKRNDVPEGANIRMEMELLSVEPPLPDIENVPYRLAELAVGKGNLLACGMKVAVRIQMWDLHGKLLYSNTSENEQPLVFTPGRSDTMMGLEHGVLGMNEGGYRLLIIPPAYQRTMSGKQPKISLPLPKDETVMVEVASHALPNP